MEIRKIYELGECYYYGTNENLIEAEFMYRKRSTISLNAYEFYKKLAE